MSSSIVPPVKRCSKCSEEKPHSEFHASKRSPDGRRPCCKKCRQTNSSKLIEQDKLTWPDGHKRCTKCRHIKPHAMFSPDTRRSPDGLFSWCKSCHSAHSRDYYSEHQEERAAYAKEWRAANIDYANEYGRNYHAANRERENARSRKWREGNLERAKETFRLWYRENRERVANNHRKWRAANRAQIRAYFIANRAKLYAANHKFRAMHPDRYRAYKHNRRARELLIGGYFTPSDISNIAHIQQGHCCYCGRTGVPLEIEHIIPITREGSSNDPWNLALACKSCNSSKGDRLLSEWVHRWYLI